MKQLMKTNQIFTSDWRSPANDPKVNVNASFKNVSSILMQELN